TPHSQPTKPHSFPTRRSSDLGSRKLPGSALELVQSRLPAQAEIGSIMARDGYYRSASTATAPIGAAAAPATAYTGSHTAQTADRSEEHTSELQSRENLVCRLP